LRWYWSQFNGSDRLRLAQAAEDPHAVRSRMIRFIERAETF
jgi:hypothetical protein